MSQVHTMLPQYVGTESVEGADVRPFFEAGHQRVHPLRHRVRRLVRERQRQDAKALVARGFQKAGNPVGQYPGLAGAGAGQYEQGAIVSIPQPAAGCPSGVSKDASSGLSHQSIPAVARRHPETPAARVG